MDVGTQRIVIVGGGTAGWMAAAIMAHFRPPPHATVTLIESEEIGRIGVGEATVPILSDLHRLLGLSEPEFIAATQGSFKLGIEFLGWRRAGSRHFHGFGDYGEDVAGAAAHHGWLRLRDHGLDAPIDEWSMPNIAGTRDRFAPAQALKGEASGAFAHAYHFDAALYAAFLRRHAESRGVTRVEGRIAAPRRAADGDVAAVMLNDGREVAGDLFLDCSGFQSLLIGQALGVPFIDWSHWLPVDRAIAVPTARAGRFTPFTRATAHGAGWQWRIPLQHRTGNGIVYSSAHLSDDEAAGQLLAGVDGTAMDDLRHLRFATGRRASFWEANVVAIGLSAGFMEPLESSGIQLIQTGLARLVSMLPNGPADPAVRVEYNRQTALQHERIRDFLIAHYCIGDRPEPFWAERRATALPDELSHKIALWEAIGQVPMLDQESYSEASWAAILLGQGLIPKSWNPVIDRMPVGQLSQIFDARRAQLMQWTERMPPHDYFIDRTCRAQPA